MNKYQTALNALRKLENPDYYYCGESNCDALQKLVDKEKPMKTDYDGSMVATHCKCPMCHSVIEMGFPYCPNCGQRLNWEEKTNETR